MIANEKVAGLIKIFEQREKELKRLDEKYEIKKKYASTQRERDILACDMLIKRSKIYQYYIDVIQEYKAECGGFYDVEEEFEAMKKKYSDLKENYDKEVREPKQRIESLMCKSLSERKRYDIASEFMKWISIILLVSITLAGITWLITTCFSGVSVDLYLIAGLCMILIVPVSIAMIALGKFKLLSIPGMMLVIMIITFVIISSGIEVWIIEPFDIEQSLISIITIASILTVIVSVVLLVVRKKIVIKKIDKINDIYVKKRYSVQDEIKTIDKKYNEMFIIEARISDYKKALGKDK